MSTTAAQASRARPTPSPVTLPPHDASHAPHHPTSTAQHTAPDEHDHAPPGAVHPVAARRIVDAAPSAAAPVAAPSVVAAPLVSTTRAVRAAPPPAATRIVVGSPARVIVAALIDSVLGGAAYVALARVACTLLDVRASAQGIVDAAHHTPGRLIPLVVLLPVVVTAHHALCALLWQGTLGHRALGMRIVDLHGAPLTRARSVVRAVVVGLTTLACGAGPLYGLLLDRWRRGLGDVVAGTVVVRR